MRVKLTGILAVVVAFGSVLVCQGADLSTQARAALAISQAKQQSKSICDCASCQCTPSNNCGCGGTMAKKVIVCPACGLESCNCGCGGDPNLCECNHPKTKKATDGGPDWTWDPVKKNWWRKVSTLNSGEVGTAAPAVLPPVGMFPPPSPVPFFAPQPFFRGVFGGGSRRGGSC